jgi:predicted Zn-dependent peptidase
MQFKKTTLKNGLRVITMPNSQSLAATVLVLVEAGSKYETKEINGLSHFLEHMCFKGTTKRPKAIDISSELDSLGAQYNAFTSQEYTGYYAKVQPKYFDKALEIVSDLYLDPLFKQEEIEKEKGVIVEEINMYEDLPQKKVQELFQKVLYGDQPAGWSIAGEKDIVRKMTRDDFLSYRGKHYVASATIIVAAGNFDENAVFGKIEAQFGSIPVSEKHPKVRTDDSQSLPQSLLHFKESDQTHLVLGVRSCDIFNPNYYAFEVLAGVLGGGMSSRLFQRIREEMGAAYYVRAANDSATDHGALYAFAGVDNGKVDAVIRAIIEEFGRLKTEKVGPKELQMVKDAITGSLFLSLETSDEVASFLGGQEVVKGSIISPDEYARKIQEVSADDVEKVARLAFVSGHLNLALIGPNKENIPVAQLMKL